MIASPSPGHVFAAILVLLFAGQGFAAPPAANSFIPARAMKTARYYHTATLLNNGRVLVSGGYGAQNEAGVLASAELYDPSTGRWLATGSMLTARVFHTATLLPTGLVLVCGGQAEYNPDEGYVLASAELYNPATGRWQAVAPMHGARNRHTATLLPGGEVLIIGGYSESPSETPVSEYFNPTTRRWRIAEFIGTAPPPVVGHTATLLHDGQVLITGGVDSDVGASNRSLLFNPVSGETTTASPMLGGRDRHAATLLNNGQVLVTCGRGLPADFPSYYDPSLRGWNYANNNDGGIPDRVAHTATLLINGQVLIVGGDRSQVSLVADASLYFPEQQVFSTLQGPATARARHTATLLNNGRVLIAGGSILAGYGMAWSRPYMDASYYPFGWPELLYTGFAGGKYTVTPGQSVFTGNTGPGGATLSLYNGRLIQSVIHEVGISSADAVTPVPATDHSFTLAIDRATGFFHGSFLHEDGTRPAFQGLIYPRQDVYEKGQGFFLTTPSRIKGLTGQAGLVIMTMR